MASVILLFPSYFLHKSVDVDWGVRLHLSHVFEFSLNAVACCHCQPFHYQIIFLYLQLLGSQLPLLYVLYFDRKRYRRGSVREGECILVFLCL